MNENAYMYGPDERGHTMGMSLDEVMRMLEECVNDLPDHSLADCWSHFNRMVDDNRKEQARAFGLLVLEAVKAGQPSHLERLAKAGESYVKKRIKKEV